MNSLSNYFFAGKVINIMGAKEHGGNLLFEFIVKQTVSNNDQTLTVVVEGTLAKLLGTSMNVGDHVVGYGVVTWRNEFNNVPMCKCFYLYKTAFWGSKNIAKKKAPVQVTSNEKVIWDE